MTTCTILWRSCALCHNYHTINISLCNCGRCMNYYDGWSLPLWGQQWREGLKQTTEYWHRCSILHVHMYNYVLHYYCRFEPNRFKQTSNTNSSQLDLRFLCHCKGNREIDCYQHNIGGYDMWSRMFIDHTHNRQSFHKRATEALWDCLIH